jgi:Fibronectin type III domain
MLQVSWRPPTKNSDRIESYKLMMATTSGLVKEVAQGLILQHHISSLRPGTEYIFCVKAQYADGSFLWSASKSYKTLTR